MTEKICPLLSISANHAEDAMQHCRLDRIVHESVRNGGGGKKHRFYYSNIKFSTVGGKPSTVDA